MSDRLLFLMITANKVAFINVAPLSFEPSKSAAVRSEPLRSALLRSALLMTACRRSQPDQFTPGAGAGLTAPVFGSTVGHDDADAVEPVSETKLAASTTRTGADADRK